MLNKSYNLIHKSFIFLLTNIFLNMSESLIKSGEFGDSTEYLEWFDRLKADQVEQNQDHEYRFLYNFFNFHFSLMNTKFLSKQHFLN